MHASAPRQAQEDRLKVEIGSDIDRAVVELGGWLVVGNRLRMTGETLRRKRNGSKTELIGLRDTLRRLAPLSDRG